MVMSNMMAMRVPRSVALVMGLLLLAIAVALIVFALMAPQPLPSGYRIESLGMGQSVLLDAAGNSPIPNADIELERVVGPWIMVKDDGTGGSLLSQDLPIRYYLVHSRSGEVTQSTDLAELLRIIHNDRLATP